MLGLAYNPRTRIVASLAALTEPGPIQPQINYPLTDRAMHPKGGRFAFGYTCSVDVTRLLANHYLDLRSFTAHRHWPRPDMVFECETRAELSEIASKGKPQAYRNHHRIGPECALRHSDYRRSR